jgi:hypothetical protein
VDLSVLVEEEHETEVADALLWELVARDQLETFHLPEVRRVAEHVDEEELRHIAVAVRVVFVLECCRDPSPPGTPSPSTSPHSGAAHACMQSRAGHASYVAGGFPQPVKMWCTIPVSQHPGAVPVRIAAHSLAMMSRSSAKVLQARTARMSSLLAREPASHVRLGMAEGG